jgi:hypothetical protein
MEQKRRGRPPGPKKEIKIELNTTEPRKRGRKAAPKIESISPEVVIEGEVEGTTTEKLKFMAIQVQQMDKTLDLEPYRMDIRMRKHEAIQRMCHLIESL